MPHLGLYLTSLYSCGLRRAHACSCFQRRAPVSLALKQQRVIQHGALHFVRRRFEPDLPDRMAVLAVRVECLPVRSGVQLFQRAQVVSALVEQVDVLAAGCSIERDRIA